MDEEITDAMYEAGIEAMPLTDDLWHAARSDDPGPLREIVSAIYLAMRRAALSRS